MRRADELFDLITKWEQEKRTEIEIVGKFSEMLNEDKNFLSKGLYALEQVLDHKDRFNVSVSSKLGKKAAEAIGDQDA